jgi:hypothetical protein
VHFIEQGRRFLDFIEHNPSPPRTVADDGLESMGIAGKFQIQGGVKQVQAQGLRENLPKHGALTDSAGSKQEKGAIGALQEAGNIISSLGVHAL